MLCQFYSPFPAFLDLVMELGLKTSDIEDNTATCSRRIHVSEEDGSIESYGKIFFERDPLSDSTQKLHTVYATWKSIAEMSLQTLGLLGMRWYISDTALVVAFPHGFCFKYRGPFSASSDAHFQEASSIALHFLHQDRTLQPFMHCFWSPVNANGTHT